MQAIVDTKYFKNTYVISPGKVGSVGDVLGSVRLKQSAPDMAMRYEKSTYGKNESRLGSNVQDGFSQSYTSGGGPSRTLDSRWTRRSFKTNHGWVHQDLRAPDKLLGERMGSTGRYDWYNRVANIYEAKRTGDMFLPLPGPYGPKSMTRGSQAPRIIALDQPTLAQPAAVSEMGIVGYNCTDKDGNVTFTPRVAKQTPTKAPPSTAPAANPPATNPPAANPPATNPPAANRPGRSEEGSNPRSGPTRSRE